MKVYVITNVARQVEGEYIFVKIDKVYKTREAAEKALGALAHNPIVTHQNVQCRNEIGILEADLEE